MRRTRLIILAGIALSFFMMGSMALSEVLDYGEFAYRVSDSNGMVSINPGGKGDALIFPYYDVRETGGKAQATYFAIVNNDPEYGVAARLRFREWGKGAETLEFNIWLSANDVWFGRLERNPTTGTARIFSSDSLITSDNTTTFTVESIALNGIDFRTVLIVPPMESLSKSDMTLMGFFEVIGEERTAPKSSNGAVTRINTAGWDCGNVLSGYAYFVREKEGISMGYNATALVNFNRQETTRLWASPVTIHPNLSDCEDGLDQLEFELSKSEIYAGWDIADEDAKYSMVATFPTKHFHFTGDPDDLPPFTGASINAGERIGISIYDRSENLYQPNMKNITLPWAVNVVGLYRDAPPLLPDKSDRNNVGFQSGGYKNGWVSINLHANLHGKSGDFGHFGYQFQGYFGIPALGVVIEEFQKGSKGKFYGGMALPVFYREQWQTQSPQ